MHILNYYKHYMSFSKMLRYMCTIFRDSFPKNHMLLGSSYFKVRWSVAVSSLTLIIHEKYACTGFKTYSYTMFKNITYR